MSADQSKSDVQAVSPAEEKVYRDSSLEVADSDEAKRSSLDLEKYDQEFVEHAAEFAPSRPASSGLDLQKFLWLVCATWSLVSAGCIFAQRRSQWTPFILLMTHLVTGLAIRAAHYSVTPRRNSGSPTHFTAGFEPSSLGTKAKALVGPIASSMCFGITALTYLLALSHVETPVIAFMIATLVERLTTIFDTDRNHIMAWTARTCVGGAALFFMLHGRTWHVSSGFVLAIIAASCAGVSNTIYARFSSSAGSDVHVPAILRSDCRPSTAAMLGALFVSLPLAHMTIDVHRAVEYLRYTNSWLLLSNVLSTALAVEIGGSLVTFRCNNSSSHGTTSCGAQWRWQPLMQVCVAGLASAMAHSFGFAATPSFDQVLAFLAGVTFLTHGPRFERFSRTGILDTIKSLRQGEICLGPLDHVDAPEASYVPLQDLDTETEARKDSVAPMPEKSSPPPASENGSAVVDGSPQSRTLKRLRSLALILVTLISWVFTVHSTFTASSWGNPAIQGAGRPKLDLAYSPPADVDLVLSFYHEHMTDIAAAVKMVKDIEYIKERSFRLFIYTKEDSHKVDYIKKTTNATDVVKLPNVAREGGTYLNHIISHYDDLAAQTIFTQVGMEMPELVKARLEASLKENTGMLGLGFDGTQMANCSDASGYPHDENGWREHSSVIGKLHEQFNGNETCTGNFLLSFKGQFVASARRIRAVANETYADLHTSLTTEQGYAHSEAYLGLHAGAHKDNMNAPHFGYTLERMWCTMMQCADPVVGHDCPTQNVPKGVSVLSAVGDCLCFDDSSVSVVNGTCSYTKEIGL